MAIRSVVFDLDGTLVDSAPDIIECIRLALAEAGVATNRPLTEKLIGPPVSEMLRVWNEDLTEEQVATVLAHFRRIYDGSPLDHTTPYSGIPLTLSALASAGITLFVATNKPVRATQRILERHFPHVFADLCCVDSQSGRKLSKEEMLRLLRSRHDLSSRETVIVGDGESDLRAGSALGWQTMATLYGYGAPDALKAHNPTWAVTTAAEIGEKLLLG